MVVKSLISILLQRYNVGVCVHKPMCLFSEWTTFLAHASLWIEEMTAHQQFLSMLYCVQLCFAHSERKDDYKNVVMKYQLSYNRYVSYNPDIFWVN